MRRIKRVEEREQGRVGSRLKKNLKLSLRESVAIQTNHWPDRLHKSRNVLVWTDLSGRIGVNWTTVGQIFREGIYLGVSVMSIYQNSMTRNIDSNP